jgi:flagellar assembly factor FliW
MNAEKIIKDKQTMKKYTIQAPKIGQIEFENEDILTMSSPMLGFPKLKRFLLISTEQTFPFYWLQSVDNPEVSFLMLEASLFFNDYAPKLSEKDLQSVKCEDKSKLRTFAIVVVPKNPKDSTANLKAPIIINEEKMLAKQIILDDDKYSIKTKIFK